MLFTQVAAEALRVRNSRPVAQQTARRVAGQAPTKSCTYTQKNTPKLKASINPAVRHVNTAFVPVVSSAVPFYVGLR